KVFYLYYAGTMQERALSLMGKKLSAALALEGQFSAEGLVQMAGEEGGSVEMQLARSLADRIDEGDARRAWAKITGGGPSKDPPPEPPAVPLPPAPAPTRAAPPVQRELFAPMTGTEVAASMKQHKVTIKDMAERLGWSQYMIQKARKLGIDGITAEKWLQVVG